MNKRLSSTNSSFGDSPALSPKPRSGIVFNNTLFGENAASHIGIGQAGANQSLIHVDWMIGSAALDIDGVRQDGTAEPLMRKGEWAA